ncbi:MAG: hypothetical protein AAGI50_07565 [Pseudomonadota bacterium]
MFLKFFDQTRLAGFVFSNFAFVFLDRRGVAGCHIEIRQLVDLPDLTFARADDGRGLIAARIPDFPEHGGQDAQHIRIRPRRFDDLANIAFEFVAFDGFALGLAGFRLAQIVFV